MASGSRAGPAHDTVDVHLAPLPVAVPASAAHAAPQELALERVVSGLPVPTSPTSDPSDATRLVVTGNGGRVRLMEGGVLRSTPLLDLRGQVHPNGGLASIALHPGFPTTPFAYVEPPQRGRLVRDTPSSDPDRLDPASAVDLLPAEPLFGDAGE